MDEQLNERFRGGIRRIEQNFHDNYSAHHPASPHILGQEIPFKYSPSSGTIAHSSVSTCQSICKHADFHRMKSCRVIMTV